MAELSTAASALISLVLLAAGIAKLRDRDSFRAGLSGYRLIPQSWSASLAWVVPIVECATAVALWTEPTRKAAALIALGLIAVFTILIARLVLDGGDAGCGCFGATSETVTWFSVVRNVILLACAVVVVSASSFEISAPAILTGIGAALLIVIIDLTVSSLATTSRLQR